MTAIPDDLRKKLDELAAEIIDSVMGGHDVPSMIDAIKEVGKYYAVTRELMPDDGGESENVVRFQALKDRATAKMKGK